MHPVKTPHCNFTFTAPSGEENNVGSIPCLMDRQQGTITSFWEFGQEERKAIASGGHLAFTVFGSSHPVISMSVMPAENLLQSRLSSLNEIGRVSHEINEANGWDITCPEHFPNESSEIQNTRFLCAHMALIHSEVSEATEAIRHRDRENFDEELADIIIRTASIAHGLGTDLEAAIHSKLEKNRARGHRHGGKAI